MDPIDPISQKLPLGLRLAKVGMKKSPYKIKVGACLIIKGSKFVIAWNKKKTCPSVKRIHGYKYENMSHAEFNLFSHSHEIIDKIKGVVYVYRELADGSPALSRPCEYCLNFLQSIGIKRVVYSTYGSYKEERI